MTPATDQQAEWFSHWFNALLDNVEQVIKGKRDQIALALVCVFSEGHLLLDDVPGTGKTSLAKAIAHSIKGTWSRIQFTPDLLPSDVTGGLVYNQSQGTFDFRRGAVFSNVVLADEINRASPKTQAALLEVMEERHVTVDGTGYDVPRPFVVIATQNPVEQEGTYRLPEAQLDRFLMRTTLGYPDHDHEVDVLRMLADGLRPEGLTPIMSTTDVRTMIQVAEAVHVEDSIRSYVVRLCAATRAMPAAAPRRVDTRRHRPRAHRPGPRRRPGPPVRHARRRAHRRAGRDGPPHAADAGGRARQGRHRRARRRGARPRRAAGGDAPGRLRSATVAVKRRRIPLTASGWTVAVLAVVAYVGGWLLGWVELMVVAAGCLHRAGRRPAVRHRPARARRRADAGAGAGHRRRPRRRRDAGDQPATHADRLAHDRGARRWPPAAPRHPAARARAGAPRPCTRCRPHRRGVVTVGPALIVKSDLLNLMRREIVQTDVQTLWVHPRVAALRPLPVGFAKDLEGPTSDASPAGDVAFHALREYELGDDHRHIHWMSTARTGTLMVRHYVDNRRPNLTVVVDTEIDSYRSERQFDLAIEVAASLGVSSLLHGQPVAVWLDRDVVIGQNRPAGRNDILDRLTLAEGAAGTDVADAALHALRAEAGTSALVVVTGNVPTDRFLRMATVARRSARVILVRTWPAGDRLPGVLPGAKVIDVDELDGFQAAWSRVAS